MTGTLVRIIPHRGFAFLKPDDEGPDVFAHIKDFPPTIPFDDTLKGKRFHYVIVNDSPKGPRASNVRPA